MNETELNPAVRNDLLDQVVALRHQVFTLLLALVVVSGTLTVFLYRQASLTGKDINAIKPQAIQIIEAFRHDQPTMEGFVNQLRDYGVHHPDFQPILKKYNLTAQPLPAAPAAPAASAAPKK